MRIGYACLTLGVRGTAQKTCIQKSATPERLTELISENLTALDQILEYNIAHNIRLFRVSSDIIPFGSSPVNTLDWTQIFERRLRALGKKAVEAGMRLSMHPGQYTVLNSPNTGVVERAIKDLEYHCAFLDALELDSSHKMILHIGGVYGDKESAIRRFVHVCNALDASIRNRLVLENDDKLYHIADVLRIAKEVRLPVIFDILHHEVHPPEQDRPLEAWMDAVKATWAETDGPQKIHYSQQAAGKRAGSHSDTIAISQFIAFCHQYGRDDLDIMLEVKDKNLSALKNIHCLEQGHISALEAEWAKYKYTVLEHAPGVYKQIRELLKDKTAYPAFEFYRLIEQAMETEITAGNAANALQHVWGYLKDVASETEKNAFLKALEGFQAGSVKLTSVKLRLQRLCEKYTQEYLLDSYYFTL